MNRRNFLKLSACFLTLSLFENANAFLLKQNYISKEKLIELSKGKELLVVYNNGKILEYNGSGISPVFRHLENNNFKNAYVFDKVTGKASALLMAYGGCKKLYTPILSAQAISILEKYKIDYSFDKLIPYIITNRNSTGRCIMETAVENIDDKNEAYKVLKAKLLSLKQ